MKRWCAGCRQRQSELDQYPQHCRCCGAPSYYVAALDRWVHLDGSEVAGCWAELSRCIA
jgi:hypothetical protein